MPFSKNIKTDYGATGNGQVALTNASITGGTNALAVSTSIFVVGDIGSTIYVLGAGAAGALLVTTISGFTDAKHVALTANATTTITALSQRVYWGSSDVTAFTNWQIDARAQGTNPCVLTIPAGIYLTRGIGDFWTGVFDLTISMDGATLADFTAGGAILNTSADFARLNQVNQGDTVLSLVTPSQTSLFTVGTWVCLSSLELQGGGYPPNWVYFEYHKIIAKGTGTITIDAPATYKHLTTYPATNPNPAGDSGGPASLFNLQASWDQSVVVDGGVGGGTLDSPGQVQLVVRSITINNCTIGPQNGVDPSSSITITLNNCTIHQVEVDKDLTLLTLNNCTCPDLIAYQSASVNSNIVGGTYNSMSGSGRNMNMSGCTVTSMVIGGIAFGENQSFAASNCSFGAIMIPNLPQRFNLSNTTYANGVFSAPNGSAAVSDFYAYGVPGSVAFWNATGAIGSPPNWGHQVTITNIRADAVNTYVSVSPALFSVPAYQRDPDETVEIATTVELAAHPAPNVTFRNCTGCADAVDFSQAGVGQPLYSYTKRTYASDAIGLTTPFVNLWGKIAFIKITVTAAASGVGPLYPLGEFGMAAVDANNFWHRLDLAIQIDLSQIGTRLITPTGVSGAVGADVLVPVPAEGAPLSPGMWSMNGISPLVRAVVTGGSVTIEMATVQTPTDLFILATTQSWPALRRKVVAIGLH